MKIQEVIEEYRKVFYCEDPSFIPVVLATVLANKLPGVPVWLMLVGGSSSGKSEIINAVSKVSWCKDVSILTANTFLSGMPSRDGKPTSLLHQIGPRGVLLMKDFTTILSMRKEASSEIMGQMREIYDGKMDKFTGAGKQLHWEGRINLVAGVTEKLFVMEDQFSGMGTRSLNFVLKEQDSKKMTIRASEIEKDIDKHRVHLQEVFTTYLNEIATTLMENEMVVPEDVHMQIIDVCEFASLARSPVEKSFKGDIIHILSREEPMRMSNQLHHIARAFMAMGYSENFEKVLYKMGLDCIPKGRRMILKEIAGHSFVTIRGLSYKIRHSEEVIRGWLEELYAFHLVELERGAGRVADKWFASPKIRDFMSKFENIENTGAELTEETGLSDEEKKAKIQDEFYGF